MTRKEVWELSAEDFFTHIITIICDYAKINGYEITDAVKTIGENLSEITEIATFDNWEINEESLVTDTNVGSKLEKTEKFNRMIEAFECDFSLIQQGEKTFAQLDENLKVEKVNVNSLRKDMDLMQELSYLIRHGKAEIWLKEGE